MNKSLAFFTRKRILFFIFAFLLQAQLGSALLITCPGKPNSTLSWTSSNVAVSGCTLQPTYSDPTCQYFPSADTSGSKNVTTGTSCNVALSCGSASASDTLEYHPELTWNGSSCVAASQPDLTAGSVSPSTGTTGSPYTLSSTITNSGPGSSGVGFNVQFRYSTSPTGSNPVDLGTTPTAALGAGLTRTVTFTNTPTGVGTFYNQACADWNGAVPESNEGNNCSGWTQFVISCPNGTAWDGSSCAANCTQQTVTWGGNCSATAGATNNGNSTSTSDASTPNTGSATFACNNGVFTLQSGSTCVAPPTIASFTNNGPIVSGNTATLTWGAVTGGGTITCSIDNSIGSATPLTGGSKTTSALSSNTTYTITCSNSGGSSTLSTTVTVTTPAGTCGTGSSATPLLSEPTTNPSSCNLGAYTNSPADTTTSGSQAWNWTCVNSGVSSPTCSAPKYGCRITTDSNYTLPQYGASGPNNNYGCASTCANGANDYSTCSTYTITASAGANGTVTPSGASTVPRGSSRTYTITPNSGYAIASVTVDGISVTPVTGSYTFTNVITNHTISATFSATSCANGASDAPLCTPVCGTGNGTPQLTEPTSSPISCNPGTYLNSPADTTTSGTQAWNWSCTTTGTASNASCSAPKYGCRITTDSNYGLAGYGASGPNNNYGCASTCANGATDYSTCTTPPTIASFTNNGPIVSGNTATLTWGAVTGGGTITCTINNSIGSATPLTGGNRTTATLSTSTTYIITCSNAGGTATRQTTVTVTTASSPDLTAGAVSPTTATVNVASTFSSTISNIGNASTGGSFNNFMQVATAANGGGTITDLASANMGTLAAGGTNTHSRSYTFPSAGTYSMRACADKSDRNTTTSNDSVNESYEDNNCGGWTNVTVSSPATPTATITVADCIIVRGGASCVANISWTSSNLTATPSVRQNGTQFSSSGFESGMAKGLTYGSNTFTFVHSGTTLDSKIGTASCGAGDVWDGSKCDIPPTGEPSGDCTTPWGSTVWNGSSVMAYQSATVPYGSNCVSERRYCTDGTLSGSYTNQTCTTSPNPDADADMTLGSCYIQNASSTCTATVSWTSSNVSNRFYVQQNDVTISRETSSTGQSVTLTYGGGNHFTILNNGYNLYNNYAWASCASGTWWNGTTCALPTDLTAGAISPTTATATVATTFSSIISNIGTASTGVGFNNFIQVATAADGGGTIYDLPSVSMSALPAGGTGVSSQSYTFPSAGTYSIRACADKTDRNTTTSNDSVSETDENNNCSAPWTNITVVVGADLVVGDCAIASGASSCKPTISWSSNGVPTTRTIYRDTAPSALVATGLSESGSIPSGQLPTLVGPGSYTFSFRGNGTTYSTDVSTVTCAGGNSWNGNRCVVSVDLTAGAISPTTAIVNVPTTFSSTISNIGSGSTGGSFNNFMQVATAADGEGTIYDLPATNMGTLAGGETGISSQSYTFPSAKTYSMRACADKTNRNTVIGGDRDITTTNHNVVETNEDNNCSAPWTNITVGATATVTGTLTMPATCEISSPNASCPTNVSWTTSNATNTVTVERAYSPFGTISGGTGTTGSANVNFSPPGTYTLNLRHDGATLDSKTITVTCVSNSSWNGNVCEVASPQVTDPALEGNNTTPGTISFSCSNSTTYSITRTEGANGIYPIIDAPYTGPISVPVSTSGNYNLICSNSGQSDTVIIAYNSTPAINNISLVATPATAKAGTMGTISWIIYSPNNSCTLTASPVYIPGAGPDAGRDADAAALTALLATPNKTDVNDPYGERPMNTALRVAVPGLSGKAVGKKSLLLQYTTDFLLNCGGSSRKVRVQVANENEG